MYRTDGEVLENLSEQRYHGIGRAAIGRFLVDVPPDTRPQGPSMRGLRMVVDAPINAVVVHLFHEQRDFFYGDMVIELGILYQHL
jgi:hypothetical protein